jgi:hypothetical protein
MRLKHWSIAIGLAALSCRAGAQEWDWKVTPYLWGAGIEGDIALGSISRPIDINFGDLVDVLSGAALVHVEANRDVDGLFGDLVWMSLEPDDATANIGVPAEASFDTTIIEAGYVRELSSMGLELGVRYWDMELEIGPAMLPAVERSDDWTDFFIGIRQDTPLGDKWRMTSDFSIGAGGSDFTYGINIVFAREFQSGNAFVTGIKVLGVDYSNESVHGLAFDNSTVFTGATVGYSFD